MTLAHSLDSALCVRSTLTLCKEQKASLLSWLTGGRKIFKHRQAGRETGESGVFLHACFSRRFPTKTCFSKDSFFLLSNSSKHIYQLSVAVCCIHSRTAHTWQTRLWMDGTYVEAGGQNSRKLVTKQHFTDSKISPKTLNTCCLCMLYQGSTRCI